MSDDKDRRRVSPWSEAAAIIAVLAFAIGATFLITDWNASRGLFEYHNAQQHQDHTQERYCNTLAPLIPSDPSADGDKAKSDQTERQRYDLCHQWRMAKAAETEVINSGRQVPLAIFSLVLLGIATVSAILAALYAKGAVRTGDEANKILKSEQRAWVKIENLNAEFQPNAEGVLMLGVRVDTVNVGSRPATEVSVHVTMTNPAVLNIVEPGVHRQIFAEQIRGHGQSDDWVTTIFPADNENHGSVRGVDGVTALHRPGRAMRWLGITVSITYRPYPKGEVAQTGRAFMINVVGNDGEIEFEGPPINDRDHTPILRIQKLKFGSVAT